MRRSGIRIMGSLIGLVRPLIFIMMFAVVLGVAGYLCAIALPVLAASGILMASGGNLPGWLPDTFGHLFLLLGICAVLRGILHYGEQACNHYIAFKLLASIRHRVFQALRRLCPAKLEGADRGNLVAVITSDIELLEVFYAHTISPAAIALITSLIMTVWVGSFHIMCAVFAACSYFIVGVVLPLWNSQKGSRAGMEYRNQFGELNSFLLDSLRGLQEIIQYGQGEQRLAELNQRSASLSGQQGRLSECEGASGSVTGACITGLSFVMLFLALFLKQKEMLDFEGLVLVTVSLMSSFGPVTALSNLSNNLNQTLACGERVLAILEEEPLVSEVTGKEDTVFRTAACDYVTFSYEDEPVLKNLSLTIPAHKIYGICGKSGSGKSTILKLLMRFWDADEGKVVISGRDIRQINTADLRSMEGFVTQETVLFHDTIANNIAVGKKDATRAAIMEAARKASIHDFIESLPNGYDTNTGELGDQLSGGERQRIGIARAFLHDAPLLLLDEPTSNLDSLNEGIILKSLKEEKEDRTIVLVSHRQSTMGIADAICELEAEFT
ncbi:MAG: amino acid ABC transporter ATP-binding/permease protein [Lachnospiraceae bacterium]